MSEELATVRLVGAGLGGIALAVPPRAPSGGRWLSTLACDALVRAAYRLGFLGLSTAWPSVLDWGAVVDAVGAGCLEDILSEAIEEQEDEHGRRPEL